MERGRVGGVVNRIKPDLLRDWRSDHGCVVGGVDGAEAGSEGSNALVAVHRKLQDFHRQRISRLGPFYEEWPGERIVTSCHTERVAGLLDGVAKAVHGVGFQYVTGFQASHWSVRCRIGVFQLAGLDFIAYNER